MPLIEDWGAGLGIGLYEEAVTHFLGGEDRVLLPVPPYFVRRVVAAVSEKRSAVRTLHGSRTVN
jgi:hypothetical protein